MRLAPKCFQFLGIPPKGEQHPLVNGEWELHFKFPISRDPPEGGTPRYRADTRPRELFPISRDPPEGGTWIALPSMGSGLCFQFLGIPPKGEPQEQGANEVPEVDNVSKF